MNTNLVNIDGSTYSGDLFTSTVDPRTVNPNARPLPVANNVEAANASKFVMNGGKKIYRKKYAKAKNTDKIHS